MSVVVRRATKADAGKIGEFAAVFGEQHVSYDPVRFARIITAEGATHFYGSQTEATDAVVLVAEVDDQIAGFAYLQYEPRFYEDVLENAVWLHDIYLDEAARGKGAGAALMDGIKREARGFGAKKIVLSVAEKNAGGQAFFKREGFYTTMHEMMLVLD